MKKVITLCLVVLICLSTAFAGDNYAGFNVGYSWSSGKVKTSINGVEYPELKVTKSDIHFGATGANYFTDSIGVGYGLGFSKIMSYKTNDIAGKVDELPLSFEIGAKFLYKYNFNTTFALDSGIGVGYAFSSKKENGFTTKTSILELQGKVGVLATLQEHFALGAGANIAIPLMYKMTVTDGTNSFDYSYKGFQFGIGPYISLMYRY